MSVVRHASPDAFLVAAQPVLARDEAMASSYVAWAHGLTRNPPTDGEYVYFATYGRAGAYGAAVRRGIGSLWVGTSDTAAAAAFAEDLFSPRDETPPALQGVAGAMSACDAFAHAWEALTGRGRALRFHMRNHKLTRVEAVAPPAGAARVANADDVAWLTDAQLDFMREIRLPDDPARMRAMVPARVARGQFWIWDDGGPTALAGWTDAPPNAARIAPVYTLPTLRGRGNATALVASLSQWLLDDGRAALFLTTDVANPVSNSIYAKVGYRPLTDLFHFDFVDAAGSGGASH